MPSTTQYQPSKFFDVTTDIADAATISGAVDLGGLELVGLFIPSSFDGAAITLQTASSLSGTYVSAKDESGSDISFTAGADSYIAISNLTLTAGLRFIKLVSDTAQSGAAATITLALRQV